MHVTGKVDEPLPEKALQRLISLYVVQTLDGSALAEACDYLVDTYLWCHRARGANPSSPTRVISKPKVHMSKARQIEFED